MSQNDATSLTTYATTYIYIKSGHKNEIRPLSCSVTHTMEFMLSAHRKLPYYKFTHLQESNTCTNILCTIGNITKITIMAYYETSKET